MKAIAWIPFRAAVIAAPFVLHLGTRHSALILGGAPLPVWTVVGSFLAAGAAIALALHDFRAAQCSRKLMIGLVVAALPLTPFVAVLLLYVVSLLTVVLALPYAIAIIGMVMRVVRRWNTGPRLIE